jgi:hypothetical protein
MHFHYFYSAHLNAAFNGRFMGEGDTQEPNVRFMPAFCFAGDRDFLHTYTNEETAQINVLDAVV